MEIDGIAIPPELARVNFLERTLRTSRVIDPPVELDAHAAVLGVIFVYPTDGLPERVTLRWDVTGTPSLPEAVRKRFLSRYSRRITQEGELVMTSQRFRDQGRNVADCLEKLREMLLAVADAPKPRKRTRPSRASVERRLSEKKARSQSKARRRRPRDDD